MRRIAVIGAGQAGAQLALSLLGFGYRVTLFSGRTPDQIRSGGTMSGPCMVASWSPAEPDLGVAERGDVCPRVESIAFRIGGQSPVSWSAPLTGYTQMVDQRVKCADWIERFVAAGGELAVSRVGESDLDRLAVEHDLVVVAGTEEALGGLFPPDPGRSVLAQPQRVPALTYVSGMTGLPGARSEMTLVIAPDVGEYISFPALTVTGRCDVMLFKGVPGGPMDCWADVTTAEQHLARSLEILERHFPEEYERCRGVGLTDVGGVLRGQVTPTVRQWTAVLPSGRPVLGLGDAGLLTDPIPCQGSDGVARVCSFYLASIIARGDRPFDERWMRQTFDGYRRGRSYWAMSWANLMLHPPPHVEEVLRAAAEVPAVAAAVVAGFDDTRPLPRWWFDAAEAARFVAQARAVEASRADTRDLRNALSQFATGVTVVTARAPDGRRIGITANSFASVSLDPPLVAWCPAKNAPALAVLTEATHFAVNVLAADQHRLSHQFATPADDKFSEVDVSEGISGLPLIEGAVARFQCRTVNRIDAGDHFIYVGLVEHYDAPGGSPLVFHSGLYHVPARHPDL